MASSETVAAPQSPRSVQNASRFLPGHIGQLVNDLPRLYLTVSVRVVSGSGPWGHDEALELYGPIPFHQVRRPQASYHWSNLPPGGEDLLVSWNVEDESLPCGLSDATCTLPYTFPVYISVCYHTRSSAAVFLLRNLASARRSL
ncbi:hypothetical protein AMAG_19982 [Allomyces macrogynus ATCC 38327]|uniref:Uncharacterized protein n=1 Tax=Allomyces macrogynus (strain ATCC 38327) TaxID=578462 RepID=A0A0L0T447_ALLM3|nr:hypothetical protein AMAG_19982 [Allomyces macrogynus ATCC 38327]|eukprot:KNE69502.1 hypothetical protein AMAG_19982 [Allomyces macrogynus ATCC 38327]